MLREKNIYFCQCIPEKYSWCFLPILIFFKCMFGHPYERIQKIILFCFYISDSRKVSWAFLLFKYFGKNTWPSSWKVPSICFINFVCIISFLFYLSDCRKVPGLSCCCSQNFWGKNVWSPHATIQHQFTLFTLLILFISLPQEKRPGFLPGVKTFEKKLDPPHVGIQ